MSCTTSGLWHLSTDTNKDIFHIVEVLAVTVEIVCILLYVRTNRNISVNSNITDKSIVINDYEDTVDDYDGYEKLARKIKKANKNTILPVYFNLLKWFIFYQIIMIIYSLAIFVLSINKTAIKTVTKYIIIAFEGFIVNFFWYSFMYLIIWSFIQKSSGKNSWRRSAYISLFLGVVHGAAFIFMFEIIVDCFTTRFIIMTLCSFDLSIFIILIYYMVKYPRKRYKKSLICYTLIITVIHIIWLILNIFAYINKNGSFYIYYIFDVLRQLIFPIILFFTLKYDSEYWSEMAYSIMCSNHARLSIWDEYVDIESTNYASASESTTNTNTNLSIYDEVINLAASEMQIPIFEWCCLGIDNDEIVGLGTYAHVLLGKYKGRNVAIKCIVCDELDIETMHLFYKEALLSLSLQSRGISHPNIVQFLGIAIQPPELCLIYEYCKHKSLTNVLQNVHLYSNISYIQILYMAQDIAKGMKYLHKHDIIHRDLKTDNVLIHSYTANKSNTAKYPNKLFIAKVCDFGLARKVEMNQLNPNDMDDEAYIYVDDHDELAQANGCNSPSLSSIRSIRSIRSIKSKNSAKSSISEFILSTLGINTLNMKSKKKKQKQKKEIDALLIDEDGYVLDDDDSDDKKSINSAHNYNKHKPQLMTTEVGTVAFLPPEILANVSFADAENMGDVKILSQNTLYAQSIDVFSFGCIMWELIMRDQVYKEYKTAQDIRNAIINGNYPKIPTICPDNYTNLISACWERNPFKRPAFQFINNKLKQMIKETNSYTK